MKLELNFALQETKTKQNQFSGISRQFIAETEINGKPVAIYSHSDGIDIQIHNMSDADYKLYTVSHQDVFTAIIKELNKETG